MKLPDDPKERKQMMLLAGIFAVGILFGLYKATDSFLVSKKRDAEKQVAGLERDIRKAQKKIKRMRSMEISNKELIKKIKNISDTYILQDLMGNYLLGAQEQMEAAASRSKTTIAPVQEIGKGKMPPVPQVQLYDIDNKPLPLGPPPAYVLQHYTARVTVKDGTHDMIRIIKEAEAANPFFCISAIEISGQQDTPGKHEMTFDVQWPIWDMENIPEGLLASFKEDEASAALPDVATPPAGGTE